MSKVKVIIDKCGVRGDATLCVVIFIHEIRGILDHSVHPSIDARVDKMFLWRNCLFLKPIIIKLLNQTYNELRMCPIKFGFQRSRIQCID